MNKNKTLLLIFSFFFFLIDDEYALNSIAEYYHVGFNFFNLLCVCNKKIWNIFYSFSMLWLRPECQHRHLWTKKTPKHSITYIEPFEGNKKNQGTIILLVNITITFPYIVKFLDLLHLVFATNPPILSPYFVFIFLIFLNIKKQMKEEKNTIVDGQVHDGILDSFLPQFSVYIAPLVLLFFRFFFHRKQIP